MKNEKKTIEITPIIKYVWSRSHCGLNNYLTIEQTAYIQINNTVAELKRGKITRLLQHSYEIDTVKERKEVDDILSATHFLVECMSKDNIATKDYKHFRIIFANGKDIIVNNYEEFEKIIKEELK